MISRIIKNKSQCILSLGHDHDRQKIVRAPYWYIIFYLTVDQLSHGNNLPRQIKEVHSLAFRLNTWLGCLPKWQIWLGCQTKLTTAVIPPRLTYPFGTYATLPEFSSHLVSPAKGQRFWILRLRCQLLMPISRVFICLLNFNTYSGNPQHSIKTRPHKIVSFSFARLIWKAPANIVSSLMLMAAPYSTHTKTTFSPFSYLAACEPS